jgi:hypothetical protein
MTPLHFNPHNASIEAFTFKGGLLSTAAHDLCLRFDEFSLDIDVSSVRARVALNSIRFVSAMKAGAPDASLVARFGAGEIEANARKVFHAARVTEILCESDVVNVVDSVMLGKVPIRLSCGNKTVHVQCTSEKQGADTLVKFEVAQSALGLKSFQALFGALSVRDVVRVEVRLRGW